jgi:predicted kinase
MRKFSTYLAVGVTSTFDYVFVVDNTNTSLLEIAPYYALAKAYALPVRLVHFDAHPAACVHRNAHGVPEHVIWNMWKAARDLAPPPYWVVEESVVTDFQSYAQHQSEPID